MVLEKAGVLFLYAAFSAVVFEGVATESCLGNRAVHRARRGRLGGRRVFQACPRDWEVSEDEITGYLRQRFS